MRNSFLVRALRLFLVIYIVLLFGIYFLWGMLIFGFKKFIGIILLFYEAFRTTLPLYLPLVILDLLYVLAKGKQKK